MGTGKLLIVVDMQNDFVTGSLGSKRAESIVNNVREKIDFYRENNYRVIFTRDTHQANYLETQEGKILPVEHCIENTNGWQIYDGLDERFVNPEYVNKPAFGWKNWQGMLEAKINETDEIELVGLCTDICVVSNALLLKCFYPEVKITVDAKCCAGVTEESHKAALLTMKMCQINIINE